MARLFFILLRLIATINAISVLPLHVVSGYRIAVNVFDEKLDAKIANLGTGC